MQLLPAALQAPKPDFFEKTLPLFDVNDSIGMILTPTQFSNTPFATDIFNRNNVMGWWYKQPRYDGWNHIDAMRGNVLIRSKALMEVTCWSACSLSELTWYAYESHNCILQSTVLLPHCWHLAPSIRGWLAL